MLHTSIVEDVAAPQITDPISKRRKKLKKVHLFLNLEYIFPVRGCIAAEGSWKPDPYHPTSMENRHGQNDSQPHVVQYPSGRKIESSGGDHKPWRE